MAKSLLSFTYHLKPLSFFAVNGMQASELDFSNKNVAISVETVTAIFHMLFYPVHVYVKIYLKNILLLVHYIKIVWYPLGICFNTHIC